MKSAYPPLFSWGKSVPQILLIALVTLLWLWPGVAASQSFLKKRAAEMSAPSAVVAEVSFDELLNQFKAARNRYLQTRSDADLSTLKNASIALRAARRDGRAVTGPNGLRGSRSRSASDLARKRAAASHSPDISRSLSSPTASLGVFQDVFAESPDIDYVSSLAIDDQGRMYVGSEWTAAVTRFTPEGRFDRVVAKGNGLTTPVNIAFDDAGRIYVSDFFLDAVLLFEEDGTFVGEFASHADLSGPFGMAFDAAGNLYVSSSGTGDVLRWDEDGNYEGAFVSGLGIPGEIAFDDTGRLYVADFGTDEVLRFSSAGAPIDVFAAVDSPERLTFDNAGNLLVSTFTFGAGDGVSRFNEGGFIDDVIPPDFSLSIDGLVVDSDNRIYVANTFLTSSILHWEDDGTELGTYIPTGTINIDALAFDASGDLYIGSWVFDHILRWNADGTFDTVIESCGCLLSAPASIVTADNGDFYVSSYLTDDVLRYVAATETFEVFTSSGELDSPLGIAFDADGNLYVADELDDEILLFNQDGDYVEVFASGGGLSTPDQIAFTSDGHLLVSSYDTDNVLEYDETGTFVRVFAEDNGLSGPTGLVIDDFGRVYVSSSEGDEVLRFNADGSFDEVAASNGGLKRPYGLAIDASNRLYVSSLGTNQVLRYNVNSAPTSSGIADVAALEDAADTNIDLGAAFDDVEDADAALTYIVVSNSNAALVATSITGTTLALDYAANASGASSITVRATDTNGLSAETSFDVDVTAVNDEPSFTAGADVSITEDAGAQTVVAWATDLSAGPSDETGQTLTFTVSNDNNAIFSVQPAIDAVGTLTFSPIADGHGTATVSVQLKDDGGTGNGGDDASPTETFTITVLPENDDPTIGTIADQTILEDGSTGALAFTVADAETPAADLIAAGSSSDAGIVSAGGIAFGGSGADRTVLITPERDANGSVTISISVSDGIATTSTTFTLTVTPVNDRPSFAKGTDQTVAEDAGPRTVEDWATDLSAGPPNESSQSLEFQISNDNDELFSASPSIDSHGTLRFTPAPDRSGTALLTATLFDNGGTANGGRDNSRNEFFIITVTPTDDAPSISAIDDQTTDEDVAPGPITFTVGDEETAASDLVVSATTDDEALISALVVEGDGAVRTLTIAVAPDASGEAVVTVNVSDGTAAASTLFGVTVLPVNDAPVLDISQPFVLNDVDENDRWNEGTSVGGLLRMMTTTPAFSDVDGDPAGIAIEAIDEQNGTWQFTTDAGVTWTNVTAVSTSSARLLQADESTRVRYRPAAEFSGVVETAFRFRAWDGTEGSAGGAGDLSATGGAGAFSSQAAHASISVRDVPSVGDLQLALESAPRSAAPGTLLQYDLTYTLTGGDTAHGVVVLVVPPRFVSVDLSQSTSGWRTDDLLSYKLRLGDLAPGETGRARLTAQIDAALPSFVAALFFEASIMDDGEAGTDPHPKNNSVTSSTAVERAFAQVQWAGTDPAMETAEQLPTAFALGSNYPNPFNPSTVIPFELPDEADVRLRVFDALGRAVNTLVDERLPAGRYEITWNADALPSGAYVYRLDTGATYGAGRVLILTK